MNTPIIGAAVDYQYDLVLVALSFVISVLGSYVALFLALATNKGQDRVFGPALALGGCGIWSMHFIGMTAYKTPLYMSFAIFPTLLSLVLVVAITALGFRIALNAPGKLANLCAGGVVIGAGVVAMHYSGMYALDTRATLSWNWPIIAGSVAIAIVAATVALWLTFNVKTTLQRVIAAVVMGVAVCAMHYTGMAAATLICVATAERSSYGLDGPFLAYFVFALALITLGGSVMFSAVFQDTKTVANPRTVGG